MRLRAQGRLEPYPQHVFQLLGGHQALHSRDNRDALRHGYQVVEVKAGARRLRLTHTNDIDPIPPNTDS